MIPGSVAVSLAAFQADVTAAAPLAATDPIQRAVLLKQGNALIAGIDATLAGATGGLDGSDPSGLPTVLAARLLSLAVSSDDQADLTSLRGLVGRAVFNLAQVGN